MNKRVAVIGAGIFGISVALEMSKNFEVSLFERENEIMKIASTNNHFRHHHGYHYPRSKKTVLESLKGKETFEKEFGECILHTFPNFYSITKDNTLTSPEEYLKFCDDAGLAYEIVDPDPEIINPDMVALTLKVPEAAYDPGKLKDICLGKLAKSSVRFRPDCEFAEGKSLGENKDLTFNHKGETFKEKFDYVVDTTYAGFNKFNKSFGLSQKPAQYELMELVEFEIPNRMFGCMNMDGPFASILPKGDKGRFTVAHVEESVLKRMITDDFDGKVGSFGEIKSNSQRIISESAKHFPILNKARIIGSIYTTKVVKANVDHTDERPSEIISHGNGIYSVFAGKVNTCIETASDISRLIRSQELKIAPQLEKQAKRIEIR